MSFSVSYSHRIVLDYSFVKWVSEKCKNKSLLITKILRINQYSKENRKENIVILESDFEKLCSEGIIKDKETIRGGMFPVDVYQNFSIGVSKENLSKLNKEFLRLILGILLTGKPPYKTALLTTKEGKKKYEEHKDLLEKIENFSIKDEEESLSFIERLFIQYTSNKEMCR